MKTRTVLLIIVGLLLLPVISMNAQKYEVNVSEGKTIWIDGLIAKIIIRNQTTLKLVIECDGLKQSPNKANGMKEIYGGSVDNTGIGLSVTDLDNTVYISGASKRSEDAEYTFYVPEKSSLKVNYSSPFATEELEVIGFAGELEVAILNPGITLENITGPVTLHLINGDINASFKELYQGSPSSISAINGNIDLSLPPSTKANIKFSSFHGEIYSDCDVEFTRNGDEKSKDLHFIGGHNNSEGKLNGGGVELSLSSINGSVYLRKK